MRILGKRMVIVVLFIFFFGDVQILGYCEEAGSREDYAIVEFRNGDSLTGTVEMIDKKGKIIFSPKWALDSTHFFYESVESIRFTGEIPKPEFFGKDAQELVVGPHTVALWHINEGEGEVIGDSSGNNHHGTIHGARWVQGRFGYGLEFDGSNDYVDLGRGLLHPYFDKFTVEAWIKTDCSGRTIFSEGNAVRGTECFELVPDNNKIDAYFDKWYVNDQNITGETFIPDGVWHHVVATKDSGSVNVYVDGSLGGSGSTTRSLHPGGFCRIGKEHTSDRRDFKGIIDEVAIYNRALTPEEVMSHYGGGEVLERVLLADGSVMKGKIENLQDGKLKLNNSYAGIVSIGKEWIDRLIFYPVYAEDSKKELSQSNVDKVHLRNGDKVSGNVVRITEEKAMLSTDYSTLEIDRDRIADIDFAKGDREETSLEGIELKAKLINGDKIGGILQGLDSKYLSLGVRFCSEVKIARWALRELQFTRDRK